MKKSLLSLLFIFKAATALASECQAPSQGHLEIRLKENFHAGRAETELKEWMIHPSNSEIRQNLKEIDRRVKFAPQRLEREALLDEAQIKFEQAIHNTGRSHELENFPASGTHSKISSMKGALSIEMNNLDKEDLDVIPKEILDKLEPKVKVNYYYPYDKFEYLLTYDGKEQPMATALLKVQKAMEDNCERRMVDNAEYRHWYKESRKHELPTGASRGLTAPDSSTGSARGSGLGQ